MDCSFRNATIVLADEVVTGSVHVTDGKIVAIDSGGSQVGEDFGGDYLIPGLVELHTDQLENHYRPRPGVFWNTLGALQSHDVQIAGSGITTVFDAVRIGEDPEMPGMAEHVQVMVDAIATGVADGRLRADHLIHLRCELPTSDVADELIHLRIAQRQLGLVVVNVAIEHAILALPRRVIHQRGELHQRQRAEPLEVRSNVRRR